MAKYQKYAEYKDSGIEWLDKVPAHWNSTAIKFLAKEKDSLFLDGDWIESKDISDSGIRYITTGNVGEGRYKEQGMGYISENTFKKLSCTEVYPDDILISRLNIPIGRACIVPQLGTRVVTSVDNVIFRPDLNYIKNFLVYLFSSKDYFAHTENVARGATMQRISRGLLGNIRIVVPAQDEQQKICDFLDHETAQINTLIAKQEKLIELLKEKRQAVISHAVTKGLNPDVNMKDSGVEWLGKVPEHWTVSKLKHFVNVVDCKHITAEFFDEGIPLASIGEVKGWKVNLSNAKLTNEKYYQELIDGNRKPRVGDIIYTRNATVGEASLVHSDLPKFALGQDVCLIHIIQKLLPEFLLHFLKSEIIKIQLNSAMVGSTFKRINVDDIRNYVIVIPPIIEQESILIDLNNKIEKYDSLINFAVEQIQLMQERRTALISSAVTGKIDVRHWQNPNLNNSNNEANTELGA